MSLGRLHDIKPELPAIFAWLATNVKILGQRPDIIKIILFGSMATGRIHGESDVDLAIIVTDECDMKVARKEIRAAWQELGFWPIDMLLLPQSYYEKRRSFGGVCMEIAEDGVELFPLWTVKMGGGHGS